MLLSLSVKTKSKNPGVTKLTDNAYEVRVSKPPIKGRANSEVIDLLAKYFGVHKNQVILKSGHTSANKTVSITPSPHSHHHRHITQRIG
ncbi:MAG: hypothetical protein DRP97_06050 [Candidatus Latescibacterota bacterium]|nr:MAG: hypothetical protein DRP97_06050 [Candidatus Latescibacterota bacterium]